MASNILSRSLVALVGLFVAYHCLIEDLAKYSLLQGEYGTALHLAPSASRALEAAASEGMGSGALNLARSQARRALARSPLAAQALTTLVYVNQESGEAIASDRMIDAAGQLGWRDGYVQSALLDKAMKQGDYPAAAKHVDALLRLDYDPRGLYSRLDSIGGSSRGAGLVAARLAMNPSWRSEYLRTLEDSTEKRLFAHEKVFAELARTRSPPTHVEVARFADYLLEQGDGERAFAFWLAFAKPRPTRSGYLFDGSFSRAALPEVEEARSAFDWSIFTSSDASVSIEVPELPMDGEALHVAADGAAAGKVSAQSLLLRPGTYSLSARWFAPTSEAFSALKWKLGCSGANKRALQLLSPAIETVHGGWGRIRFSIVIPPQDCPVQRLEIGVYHDTPEQIDVWLDLIRIDKA